MRRTPRAREDVIEAAAYIGMGSMEAARRFLRAVRDECAKLAEMPGIGAPRAYRRRDFRNVRSWPMGGAFSKYLIFYRPMAGGIEVLRVLHGARNVDSAFK